MAHENWFLLNLNKILLAINGFIRLNFILMVLLSGTRHDWLHFAITNNLALIIMRPSVLQSNLPQFILFYPQLQLLVGLFASLMLRMPSFMVLLLMKFICVNHLHFFILNFLIMFVNSRKPFTDQNKHLAPGSISSVAFFSHMVSLVPALIQPCLFITMVLTL